METLPGKVDRAGHVVAQMQLQSLTLLEPRATENYTVTCPAAGSFANQSLILIEEWMAAHANEVFEGAAYKIQNWSPGAVELFATKTYSRTFQTAGQTWSESTTLQLRHTPEA
jgi:hypothetical protein